MTHRDLLIREMRLAGRAMSDVATSVFFFLIAGSLVPLALGPTPALLARVAPGVVWICALLASLLSLDRLFGSEFEDGSLDQLLLCGLPAVSVAGVKTVGHWVTTGLPLVAVSPILAAMLGLSPESFPRLLLALIPGTLLLSLLGTMGAALTVGARRAALLVPLLVLPVTVPVLVMGIAVTEDPADPALMFLLAYLVAAFSLCPLAGGAALRVAAG